MASDVNDQPRRYRATKKEMEARRDALYALVEHDQPMTVRHAYYRAVVAGVVPKTEAGYNAVQRTLAAMRRDGELPFDWLVDNTRWMRKPTTWTGIDDLLADAARTYRRALWADTDHRVEVWCESDSIAGVLFPITEQWDVPLFPVRGFSSLSFASGTAENWNEDGRAVAVIYVGDLDMAGLDIERNLNRDLGEWSEVDFEWTRLAITPEQVDEFDLPGTAPKERTARRFHALGHRLAVEAEALPAPLLRDLLNEAIAEHVDGDAYDLLMAREEEEKEYLTRLADAVIHRND